MQLVKGQWRWIAATVEATHHQCAAAGEFLGAQLAMDHGARAEVAVDGQVVLTMAQQPLWKQVQTGQVYLGVWKAASKRMAEKWSKVNSHGDT